MKYLTIVILLSFILPTFADSTNTATDYKTILAKELVSLVQDARSAGVSLMGATQKAAEKAYQEMPDLINQLLLWEGIKSGIVFTIFFTIAVLSIVITRKYKFHEKIIEDDEDGIGIIILLMVHGVFTILPFVAAYKSLEWLKIIVAPKLYLLEYIINLVK